jgi:hypothetical protein
MSPHRCVGGEWSDAPSWWAYDGRGIELCRVCDRCEAEHLAHYRPEILRPYADDEVAEPVDEEGEP